MIINWRNTLIGLLDIILAIYLVLAITSFNNPDESGLSCSKVGINISDSNNAGFLSANEIKNILERQHLYPLNKQMKFVDPRKIEEVLKVSPFVNTAECYKTKNGHVCINITQRMPIIRIKSQNGQDYYLDDKGGTLPNSNYTSDLIIATGNINKWFAQYYITPLAKTLMASDFWNNQIVQINVLPDRGIELVPRVGEHIIFIGNLPQNKNNLSREKEIAEYINKKLERLDKFYRYGLSNAGWNKYSYINLEFDNQIICKRKQ
ncbi:MAG: cell division protein FtsQ [Prevotella sp.]|nr:cell division protein FtsQ [Prevotella sp.]